MKKVLGILAFVSLAAAAVWAAPVERYLHVRVEKGGNEGDISINLPVSVAAAMLPAVDHGAVHNGGIRVGSFEVNGVDVVQILGALKNAPDGLFVTIQQPGRTIRVAKRGGMVIVHVSNERGEGRDVDISVPWAVAEALVSSGSSHELNIDAAIQALERSSQTTLVSVSGGRQRVSVWVDSDDGSQEPHGADQQP